VRYKTVSSSDPILWSLPRTDRGNLYEFLLLMAFCLDTNICIYALKGRYPAIGRHLQRYVPADITIPALVRAELLLGAKKSRSAKTESVVRQFLLPYVVLPFDESASAIYAEIRFELEKKGRPIGPNDLIIAATAMAHNKTLVTHNSKEFRRIRRLKTADWTR